MSGRPRKPSAVLELKGAFKHDPQRKRPSEPIPSGELGSAPGSMTVEEVAVWGELAAIAPPGVLTNADRFIVELTCHLMQKFRAGALEKGDLPQLIRCLSQLGLTPADRSKIGVSKAKEETNPFSEIAAEGKALRTQ